MQELTNMNNYISFIANLDTSIYALNEAQLSQLVELYENNIGRSIVGIYYRLCCPRLHQF